MEDTTREEEKGEREKKKKKFVYAHQIMKRKRGERAANTIGCPRGKEKRNFPLKLNVEKRNL